MAERAASYAAPIAGKGAPLQVWVGFIDGTGIYIAPSGEGCDGAATAGTDDITCLSSRAFHA